MSQFDTQNKLDSIVNDQLNRNIEQEAGNVPYSKQWDILTAPVPESYRNAWLDNYSLSNTYTPSPTLPFDPTAGLLRERAGIANPSLSETVMASHYLNNMGLKMLTSYAGGFEGGMGTDASFNADDFFNKESNKAYVDQILKQTGGNMVYEKYLRGDYDSIKSYNTFLSAVSFDLQREQAKNTLANATGFNSFTGSLAAMAGDPVTVAIALGTGGLGELAMPIKAGTGLLVQGARVTGEAALFSAVDVAARSATYNEMTPAEAFDSVVNNMVMSLATFGVIRGGQYGKATIVAREARSSRIAGNAADFSAYLDYLFEKAEFGVVQSSIIAHHQKIQKKIVDKLRVENPFMSNIELEKLAKPQVKQAIVDEYVSKLKNEIVIKGSVEDAELSVKRNFTNALGEQVEEGLVFRKTDNGGFNVTHQTYDHISGTKETRLAQDSRFNNGKQELFTYEFTKDEIEELLNYMKTGAEVSEKTSMKLVLAGITGGIPQVGKVGFSLGSLGDNVITKGYREAVYRGNPLTFVRDVLDNITEGFQYRWLGSKAKRSQALKDRGTLFSRAGDQLVKEGIDPTSKNFNKLVADRVDKLFEEDFASRFPDGKVPEKRNRKLTWNWLTSEAAPDGFKFLIKAGATGYVTSKFFPKTSNAKDARTINANLYGFTGDYEVDNSQYAPIVRMTDNEKEALNNELREMFSNPDLAVTLAQNIDSLPDSAAKNNIISILNSFKSNPESLTADNLVIFNARLFDLYQKAFSKEINELLKMERDNKKSIAKELQLDTQVDFVKNKVAEGVSLLAPEFRSFAMNMKERVANNEVEDVKKLKEAVLASMNNHVRDNITDWNRSINSFYDEIQSRMGKQGYIFNNATIELKNRLKFDSRLVEGLNGGGVPYISSIFVNAIGSSLAQILTEVVDGSYRASNEDISNVSRYEDAYEKFGTDEQIIDSLLGKARDLYAPTSNIDNEKRLAYYGAHFPLDTKQASNYTAVLATYPEYASKMKDRTISSKELGSLHKLISMNDLQGVQKVVNVLNKTNRGYSYAVKDESPEIISNNTATQSQELDISKL